MVIIWSVRTSVVPLESDRTVLLQEVVTHANHPRLGLFCSSHDATRELGQPGGERTLEPSSRESILSAHPSSLRTGRGDFQTEPAFGPGSPPRGRL